MTAKGVRQASWPVAFAFRHCASALALFLSALPLAAQTRECVEAFDTMTRIKEQIFSQTLSKGDLELLHHQIKARTEDCEDLSELWQLRGRLAELSGNKADLAVVKNRVSNLYQSAGNIEASRAATTGFNPAAPVGKRYALLAGTGTFQNKQRLDPLEYAEQDLKQMSSIFKTKLGFDDVQLLNGPRYTHDNFRAQIARLRETVQPNDLVVIFILSHGYPTKEDRNDTSFILTYDSKVDDPQQRYLTSIQVVDLVQELYRELRATRVLLMLDACYSGDAISGQKDYAGHPAPYLLEAFTRGSGRAVIAASGANQRSWELPEKQHGAFVYCFDQAVTKAPNAALGELFGAVRSCVNQSVAALGATVKQDPALFASEGASRITLR